MNLQNLTIINYHKIEFESDIGLTSRHPHDFDNDLEMISQNGFTTINFEELHKSSDLPSKPIIITFDDAYLSFYEKAFQTLKKKNMKAVVFVPVNYIGKKNNWDVQFFKKQYWHMNEEQISFISSQGMELGSHALSHRFLNHMSNEMIKHELKKSKALLEKITGKDILTISYPFGRASNRVRSIAHKYYKFGVQLMHSNPYNEEFNYLSLNRINIYRTDSVKTFQKKLDIDSYPFLKVKSKLIQSGAWATVIMQKIVKQDDLDSI